jgi:DNA-directed RNA polymerase subunit RPC12/RpoP
MGQLFQFHCPACGYRREVSGRPDCGMCAGTTTAVCPHCSELFDVTVTDRPWDANSEKPIAALACPRCRRRDLKTWRTPGACPKCGHRNLVRGQATVLWD